MADRFDQLLNQFNRSLKDCQRLYQESARFIADEHNHLIQQTSHQFVELMDDLHRGLMLKLFVEIAGIDHVWTREEEQFAGVLVFHLWNKRLADEPLRDTIRKFIPHANSLNWESLVRPFKRLQPLQDQIPSLETHVIRIGNLLAKADGRATSLELDQLRQVQQAILEYLHLRDAPGPEPSKTVAGAATQSQIAREFPDVEPSADSGKAPQSSLAPQPALTLADTLAQLDELIGLRDVKHEIRTLINYLKVQRLRADTGLAETKLTLHMVFGGNPGTGKTTVARILGHIYGAMGVLAKGHLVETDRSGLVAEYAGQTGPKTNKVIDSAIDGVLFIDEAYSLIADAGEDPFGEEAVQALLKRMEDDRERIVVVLAGYPAELDRMLKSNPGLSSRFGRRIDFRDYDPFELGRIFWLMCQQNQYQIDTGAMSKLLVGLRWLYEGRDEHFGNGRLVRNVFEHAIRCLANRIVESPEVTREMLVRFHQSDVQMPGVPDVLLAPDSLKRFRFQFNCPSCDFLSKVAEKFLGRLVKCKKCDQEFSVKSADPIGEFVVS